MKTIPDSGKLKEIFKQAMLTKQKISKLVSQEGNVPAQVAG